MVGRISSVVGDFCVENGTANRSSMWLCCWVRRSIPDSVDSCDANLTPSNSTTLHRANCSSNQDQSIGRCDSLLNEIQTEHDCISASDILNCWDRIMGSLGDARRPSFKPRNPTTNDSTEVAATGSRNGDRTCRDIGESGRYAERIELR